MNGADAVYLGLTRFNARAKAGNFTTEELKKAVEFCRFFGVKVYVTFNTIYKQSEYDDVITCMKECRDIGVNAFILQDFSLISRIKSTMPDIVLHLSTQAAVHNLEGALVAEKLGFTRVILSREALLGESTKTLRLKSRRLFKVRYAYLFRANAIFLHWFRASAETGANACNCAANSMFLTERKHIGCHLKTCV